MKTLNILFAGSAMVLASGAAAQAMDEQAADTATMPAQEAPAETAPAEPAMGDQAADATFSDAEVKSFAAAAVEIQALPGDDATKQQQAAQIVANSGLDAETFNAIGTAMQTDPALAQRVQLAAAELQSQPTG
ncbi:DUF4168 domain-containing protein [Qipengyuania qiaonensis]|uniref:DUF4168 domain-containing protein n=1 Tax=Qipengyuania qiaonensis TaxID=2867240 RepID=A0ABS7J2J8_9SPHN|nr:DUF4168 domain-containing protein [Qipengyuania qiaonensis]MBX7481552.1 DUF4168 domain-containing protein [Qipengyuania qiaonensis]